MKMPLGTDLRLFIVAPRKDRELAEACAGEGWPATIVRLGADAASLFAVDPARIAVVDARDPLAAGIRVAGDLAGPVEARGGALLVLIDAWDAAAAAAAYEAGATAVLAAPTATTLVASIRLARRMCDRLAAAAAVRDVAPDEIGPHNDRLTGIATTAQARAWVEMLIASNTAPDPALVVLQLAIGRFGQLNAAYGRATGDAVLQAIAYRLRGIVGSLDDKGTDAVPAGETRLVARLHGAQFALVLAGPTSLADATTFARRVAAAFEEPFAVEGHAIHLGCRIGIAAAAPDPRGGATAAERVFRQASSAMTYASDGAPGTVEVFGAAHGDDPRAMADLESDLWRALDAGEVDMLFQPQVATDSGRIMGVEALARWQHPSLGQLSAETLFRVAESAEIATRLGAHIQRQALLTAARWPAVLGGLRLALNVTAGDLASPRFLEGLDAALGESGFPRDRLTLEVTESDLIENLDVAAVILAAVRARGIEVALDDFGTGYSSLAYLTALPLDSMKVDKRLVADLSGSPRDRVVVQGVVNMARALGIRVVAEGIETEAQRATVTAAGCDWYQGFLCASPLTSDALAAFVGAWRGHPDPLGGGEDAKQVSPR